MATEPFDEPDPRYLLANERTFLAWVRTILAFVAGAVALHALDVPDPAWLRRTVVITMLVFAAVTMAMAQRRHRLVEQAIRAGLPLPPFGLGLVMTGAVVLAVTLLAVAFV